MNDTKGYRIWQWAVLLLVLCNIGLILTLWLKPQPGGPPKGGGPKERVISSLKFTDDQVKKYELLIEDHQRSMRKLKEQGAALRRVLFSGLNNSASPVKLADSLVSEIGNNQREIEIVTYNHFSQVRALCTDQQKQQFDKIIVDITRNMNGGPDGHRPPPGEGRPDGPPNGEAGRLPETGRAHLHPEIMMAPLHRLRKVINFLNLAGW